MYCNNLCYPAICMYILDGTKRSLVVEDQKVTVNGTLNVDGVINLSNGKIVTVAEVYKILIP